MGCVLSQLASKFTFFPPSPATYTLKTSDDGKLSAVFTASSIPVPIADEGTLDVLLLDTKRGNKIVAFYLRNPLARLTVLYSHGNATDLGQLFDLFLQLKANLRANLIGYDYSGYGASTGKPSESNTYSDIEAVYECLQTEYGISQEDLILYGQSVGSGPTLHLAAKLPRLRGVVLHSAILSGLRVVCRVKVTFCFDIYKNVNKIWKVKCPVLVIHGTDDDVVNVLHGNGLWKMAREPYEPLWIKGGGHCNLELYPDYIQHLCRFMQEMENITTEIRLRKIRQSLGLHKGSHTGNESATTSCCCGIKFCQPKCPECLKPSCTRCCCRSKCPESSKPRCTKCCWPKCPECFKPRGIMCCCQQPKCLKPSCSCRPKCSKPSCTKCCCMPKCPECSKLSCTKCCCLPKCPECSKLSCTKCCFPKCPECSKLSCTKCCCLPKCPECSKLSCTKCCFPKCPECSKLSCTKCCCLPKCPECSKLSCTKCCCLPKCPEFSKLSCTKCCCLPKCPEWKYRCLDCKCKSPRCPMRGCLCWC